MAEAINQLPEREKLLITLRYYEGLSNEDIGEVLGLSDARVRRFHASAIGRLRSLTGVEDEIEWTSPPEN